MDQSEKSVQLFPVFIVRKRRIGFSVPRGLFPLEETTRVLVANYHFSGKRAKQYLCEIAVCTSKRLFMFLQNLFSNLYVHVDSHGSAQIGHRATTCNSGTVSFPVYITN